MQRKAIYTPTLIEIKLTSLIFEEILTHFLFQLKLKKCKDEIYKKILHSSIKIFPIIFARSRFMSYRFLSLNVILYCFCFIRFFEGWAWGGVYFMPLPSWQVGISRFPFLFPVTVSDNMTSWGFISIGTPQNTSFTSIFYPVSIYWISFQKMQILH